MELTPAVFLLQRKGAQPNHVVVGDDAAQLRFIEEHFDTTMRKVDRVTDDMLVGQSGLLLHVSQAYRIDLSPEMRNKTGFWAADPIVKGSAAVNVIVKTAASLVPDGAKTISRDTINLVGDALTRTAITDIRSAIWRAMWMLTGDIKQVVFPKDPWEDARVWLPRDFNVDRRLHMLYRKLMQYATLVTKGTEAARKIGTSPSQIQHFLQLDLNVTQVYQTITLLSRWKQGRILSYPCALQIAAVWSR